MIFISLVSWLYTIIDDPHHAKKIEMLKTELSRLSMFAFGNSALLYHSFDSVEYS